MKELPLKKTVLSGFSYRFAERIMAQFVSTIVSIILARILMPEDYAVVSIVMVLINIFNVFVTDGLGVSLIQKTDADDTDFSTVFWAGIIFSLIIYIIVFFTAPLFSQMFNNELICPILRVMSVRLPIAAINSIQQAYLSKKYMFKKFFTSTIAGALVSGVVGVILAFCGMGPWALVVQYVMNVGISTICLCVIIDWKPQLIFSLNRFKILFSYGSKVMASGLITAIYEELRGLIIAGKYSSLDLAYYTKGQMFPSLVANNVTTSIRSVMFPVMSNYQSDMLEFKRKVRITIQSTSFVMFPLLLGFASIADTFVRVVLTDKWMPVIPFVYIFCIYYMFKPIKGINQTSIKALGRSGVDLIINLTEKILGIIFIFLSMNSGVKALAISAIITYAIAAILEMIANGIILNYSFIEQVQDVIPSLLIALVMAVPVFMLNCLVINIYIKMVIQVLVGVIIYLLLAKVFKMKAYNYLKNSIISILRKE